MTDPDPRCMPIYGPPWLKRWFCGLVHALNVPLALVRLRVHATIEVQLKWGNRSYYLGFVCFWCDPQIQQFEHEVRAAGYRPPTRLF